MENMIMKKHFLMKNDTQTTPVCGCTDLVKAMTNRVDDTECAECLARIEEFRSTPDFKSIKDNYPAGVIGLTAAEYKSLRGKHGLDVPVSEE